MLEFSSKTINTHVPVTVIRINGSIDSSNFKMFQDYVDRQVEQGARFILLNFEDVSHISSAGLRVVHNLFNSLRSLHKDVDDSELRKKMSAGEYKSPYIKLTNLEKNVSAVFNMGGFDIYLQIFQDENTAVNSF